MMHRQTKIAVIGAGGREHAIIKKLKSQGAGTIYALPGNAGMQDEAVLVNIGACDIKAVIDFCVKNAVDYVVVTPDDPLALGMCDALKEAGIRAFGPSKAAARIESSKSFAKNLMQKHGIPTAAYEVFENTHDASIYLKNHFKNGAAEKNIVIKADGLALGKGVTICASLDEALSAVKSAMIDKKFSSAGEKIVIEEFLEGPEVSILAFSDGKTLVPMASSMDHKRVFDGDCGLNTGGMGSIAPNPFWTDEIERLCQKSIFMPTIEALQKEGSPFSGCLYFGLMLTKDGPKVIEYNARFGDPETQAVLPLLESNLFDIMNACTDGTLDKIKVRFSKKNAACIILASGGYPEDFKKGFVITGLDAARDCGAEIFCAGVAEGTAENSGGLVSAGGRVLGVGAVSETLEAAIELSYKAAAKVHFENMHYRRDIGRAALASHALY